MPTSVVAVILLLAIPIIASLTNLVSDSTTKRLPRKNMFPVTSRLDVISVVSFVVEIKESLRKLSESTNGILDELKPPIFKSPPTSAFAKVTKPVVGLLNWAVFVVALPRSVTN